MAQNKRCHSKREERDTTRRDHIKEDSNPKRKVPGIAAPGPGHGVTSGH